MTAENELLPCPFPHEHAPYEASPSYAQRNDGKKTYYVECVTCGCCGPIADTPEEATALWQSRPALSSAPVDVKAKARELDDRSLNDSDIEGMACRISNNSISDAEAKDKAAVYCSYLFRDSIKTWSALILKAAIQHEQMIARGNK